MPDTIGILDQSSDIAESSRFNTPPRFRLGETVRALSRLAGINASGCDSRV